MSPESIPVSTWDEGIFESRIEIGCQKLLELFSIHQIQATWFFLGWIAERHPGLVEAVHQQGHEIATHTYDHRAVDTLSSSEYAESLSRSCQAIESVTGVKVVGHRAPMWSIRRNLKWAIEILSRQGLLYDSSINPVATYLYGEKGAPRHPYRLSVDPVLWEVPPSAIQFGGRAFSVGGGFFLRALPVWYMRYAIRRYNREGCPAVVYIHPWEMDIEHPVPKVPRRERWIHTFGLTTTERKVRALLAESQSQTFSDYVSEVLAPSPTTDSQS